MVLKIYQIDAFAESTFSGNPAAVVILDNWMDATLMQNIAEENNLAETAFVVKNKETHEIRWFTPTIEVDLCGHATLASAYVLFRYFVSESKIYFYSHRSGDLAVEKSENGILTLNFPTDELKECTIDASLIDALGIAPVRSFKGKTDYLLLYKSQSDIENMTPDFRMLSELDARGVIVSAPGVEVDFVSRWFGPSTGIDEDPVTGSAHTTLTPYWSKELGKTVLSARQLSKRGGGLQCEFLGDRVKISGTAVQYLIGEIEV